MANQIITGQKVTFFDSIDFNRKYYEGSYYATYNSLINGELHPDTILGTDIGGAIFFSPPANSYYAHITHGGKIYTLGSAVITETPTSLSNVKKNPDVDLEQPIDDSWTNGAFMTSGLVGNEKLPAYFTAAPWDKTITVNTTNVTVTDLLKVINKLCAEVAALKHGSSKIPVTPIAPQPREFYEPTEPQPLILQTDVTGVIMEYRIYTSPVSSTTPVASTTSEPSEWSREIPKAKEPAKYTVEWRAIAEDGYVLTGTTTGSVTSTIKENVPTEFAVHKTVNNVSVKYTGSAQNMLSVSGTDKHCTTEYSLDNTTWTTTIPQKNELGSYTIYWRAKVDTGSGYTFEDGTTEQHGQVNSSIVVNPIAISPSFAANVGIVYNGNKDLITRSSGQHIDLEITYKLDNSTEGTTEIPKAGKDVNAGTHKVICIVKAAHGYAFSNGADSEQQTVNNITVDQANALAKPSFITSGSKTYEGSDINLLTTTGTTAPSLADVYYYATTSNTEPPSGVEWKTTPYATHAGTWYVYYKVTPPTGNTNYKEHIYVSTAIVVNEPAVTYYWYAGWTEPTVDNISTIIDIEYPTSSTDDTKHKAGGKSTTITGYSKANPFASISDNRYYSIAKTNYYFVIPSNMSLYGSALPDVKLTEAYTKLTSNIPNHDIYISVATSRNINGIIAY